LTGDVQAAEADAARDEPCERQRQHGGGSRRPELSAGGGDVVVLDM
jgi:hypothetical protein